MAVILKSRNIGLEVQATYNTVGPHVLEAWPIDAESAGQRNVVVTARRVSDGAARMWYYHMAIKSTGGTREIISSGLEHEWATSADATALSSLAVSLAINGETLEVSVTSLDAEDMDWHANCIGQAICREEEEV